MSNTKRSQILEDIFDDLDLDFKIYNSDGVLFDSSLHSDISVCVEIDITNQDLEEIPEFSSVIRLNSAEYWRELGIMMSIRKEPFFKRIFQLTGYYLLELSIIEGQYGIYEKALKIKFWSEFNT